MRLLPASAVLLLSGVLVAQSTTRVSVDALGTEADGPSSSPVISWDGRFAAFESSATNLVPGDVNGTRDIFVVELATGAIELASVSDGGAQANTLCTRPSISHDGRFVAFHSGSSTLVAGDTNGLPDVFVRDRLLGTTILVSVTPAGVPGNGSSAFASISGDGRYVAFSSLASDLVAGDTNGTTDVFVRDLVLRTTVRASVSTAGAEGDGYSTFPALALDGHTVAFQSVATNLVAGDTNGQSDLFVRDLVTGTTERVSVSSSGTEGDGGSSIAAISADGRFVAFQSGATNLVVGDGNGVDDIFMRDRSAGTTVRVSTSYSGGEGDQPSVSPAISGDGRCVAFVCLSEILIQGDSNHERDIVLHDLVSGDLERLSLDSLDQECDGMSNAVALDASGMHAIFQGFADNLVPNDLNVAPDIFLRLRGPFSAVSCPGDGSQSQPCPCGNNGALGHGCANSVVAAGAVLEGEGEIFLDEVTLLARDLPPHALAIFLHGDSFVTGGMPFGDGLRCVAGGLLRLYVRQAQFGVAFAPGPYDQGLRARAQALGDPLLSGSLRYYQVYYRDPDANFCPFPPGNTWNATNAVSVQW